MDFEVGLEGPEQSGAYNNYNNGWADPSRPAPKWIGESTDVLHGAWDEVDPSDPHGLNVQGPNDDHDYQDRGRPLDINQGLQENGQGGFAMRSNKGDVAAHLDKLFTVDNRLGIPGTLHRIRSASTASWLGLSIFITSPSSIACFPEKGVGQSVKTILVPVQACIMTFHEC